MIVKAWNNGQHSPSGAGYGVKVRIPDRDRYFRREWQSMILELEGEDDVVEVNVVIAGDISP